MSAQDIPNDMARELAHKVRDARFARSYRDAMTRFGGQDEPTPADRHAAWRSAMPPQAGPVPGVQHPSGDHRPGEVSEAPLPAWKAAPPG